MVSGVVPQNTEVSVSDCGAKERPPPPPRRPWESIVGAFHCISPGPKRASKYYDRYNGRCINKTVRLLWNLANNGRDTSFSKGIHMNPLTSFYSRGMT